MEDREYLAHIRKAILEIKAHTTGMSEGTYLADSKTQRAVERNLQIIGEAAHRLPDVLRNTHPEIPWDQVYAARSRIVHSYFGVDQTILWDILQQDLDPLLGAVEDLLASRGPEAV